MIFSGRPNQPQSSSGFTLIEVLVAMAVVVLSFFALYGVILQMVTATTLMQEKTLASWIAFDRVTELRVTGEFPSAKEDEGTIEMGGTTWVFNREVRATESDDLRQIIVTVAPEDDPERVLGLVSGALIRNEISTDTPPPGFPDGESDPQFGNPEGIIE